MESVLRKGCSFGVDHRVRILVSRFTVECQESEPKPSLLRFQAIGPESLRKNAESYLGYSISKAA